MRAAKPQSILAFLFVSLYFLHIGRVLPVKSEKFEPAPTAAVMEMGTADTEINRRRFISYQTLIRDLVPCDRPGASYYNCREHGVANFYNRGCQIITRCARGE